MSLRKIHNHELFSEIRIIGRVIENYFSTDKEHIDQVALKIKFGRTTIFIYEKKPVLIARMKKYKKNDVLDLKGKFVAEWYPSARNALPVINDVITVKKIGTFKEN